MQSIVLAASRKPGRVLAIGQPIVNNTCLRRSLHTSHCLHNNDQHTRPDSNTPRSGQRQGSPHSHPPRRRVGRFSLPVFLFFAATFAAITSSMDTAARPISSSSSSPSNPLPARHSPDQLDTDDLDASPQSDFVDDDGNPLVTTQPYYGVDQEDSDMQGGHGGARDAEKERQQDQFGRHERHRRIPWTLREVAEAEKWQRDSRSAALRTEQGSRSVPHVRDQEHE